MPFSGVPPALPLLLKLSKKFSETVATKMKNGILSTVGCLVTQQSSIKENKCNLGDGD